MAQEFNWPSLSVSASNPSIGTNDSPGPGSSTQVAGQDDSGILRVLHTDANGDLQIDVTSIPTVDVNVISSVLPTGAATSANQTTEITALNTINTTLGTPAQEHILATSPNASRLTDGTSFYKATTPADTQPISAVSLPLPTGAATAANQTTEITALGTINTTLGTPAQEHATAGSPSSVRLSDGTTFYKATTPADTQPISAASLPLPTGAATETTLSSIDGKLNSLGQKTSANSVPVVLASDQSTIPVSQTVNSLSQFIRNDYSSTPVTTGAYVQLIASTSNAYNTIEIFDSSGQTLKIAFGGSGSEVDQFIVYPGGNGQIRYTVPAATRISIRALSATASVGEIDINLFG